MSSFCQLLANADVRFGASRIWSIETLPMLRLPAAAPAVAPATIDCRPEEAAHQRGAKGLHPL